jgi:hypothetical protein
MLLSACGSAPAPDPTKPPAPVTASTKGSDASTTSAPDATASIDATATTVAPAAGASSNADLGFRADPNGFAFANYGNEKKPVNLTAVEMRRMFGDGVCARIEGDVCTLTPIADQQMQQVNASMGGGHCEGFAVLSLLMYSGKVDASKFGADTIAGLTLDGNEMLQREIAYWFTTQYTQPAKGSIIRGTPAEVTAKLAAAYANGKTSSDTYAVGIYKADRTGGHAVTAYEVVDKGNGLFWIMVYDNNAPKKERHIDVDVNANSWQYEASPNPSIQSELYKGDANTNTLEIVPNAPRIGQQVCNFCTQPTGSKGGNSLATPVTKYNQIWLQGKSQLLITNDAGQKLGFDGARFVSTIPDASVDFNKGDYDPLNENEPPVYNIPVGMNVTAVLDGNNLKAEHDPTDLTMIGPGYYIGVEGIFMDKGEKDTMSIAGDGKSITYHTDYTETPDIILGVDGKEADFEFDLYGSNITSGSDTNVSYDPDKGVAVITTNSTEPSQFAMKISRFDDKSTQTFDGDKVTLSAKDKLTLSYGNWGGNGKGLEATIDHGGTGTNIEKLTLADTSK